VGGAGQATQAPYPVMQGVDDVMDSSVAACSALHVYKRVETAVLNGDAEALETLLTSAEVRII
jgi:hypothetical protein